MADVMTSEEEVVFQQLCVLYRKFVAALKSAKFGDMGPNYVTLSETGFPSESNRASGAKRNFQNITKPKDTFFQFILAIDHIQTTKTVSLKNRDLTELKVALCENSALQSAFINMHKIVEQFKASDSDHCSTISNHRSTSEPSVGDSLPTITPFDDLAPAVGRPNSHDGHVDPARNDGTVPMRADNKLEKVARFQFQPSGQTSAHDAVSPFLVSFTFNEAEDQLDLDDPKSEYFFSLRRAYLRIECYQSPIDCIDVIEFERRPDEDRSVHLKAKLVTGGAPEWIGEWELSGKDFLRGLEGKFDSAAIAYAQQHPDDTAKLRIHAKDIRVRFTDETEALEDSAARDVARQWLRLREVLGDRLPQNGIIDISTQTFREK